MNAPQMDSSRIKHHHAPAYLLNVPFSLSTDVPNNATMRKLPPEQRQIDHSRAMSQWFELYQFLASKSIVYLLPSRAGLQDLVYVANLGIVLPHLKEDIAVISNFRSEPRRGETEVGERFFQSMGFQTVVAPKYFEGEADLKYLRDNIYFGGHGLRTNTEALQWFRDSFDMHVIPIPTTDEHLYHLDCSIFPLTKDTVLLCTEYCEPEIIQEIEKVAEIIPVPYPLANRGLTNIVRCGKYLLCDSNLDKLTKNDELYSTEKKKREMQMHVCATHGLEPVFFNLSEYYKSGAMLSCMVMHLNHVSTK